MVKLLLKVVKLLPKVRSREPCRDTATYGTIYHLPFTIYYLVFTINNQAMTDMGLSEILNLVLGGSLLGAIVSIVTIRSALKKARADAEKAVADADTVKITNTEQATRILVENIVNPLKQELDETRKELIANRRESVRLRKAIDGANSCRYSSDCPVLERMRVTSKEREDGKGGTDPGDGAHRQRGSPRVGGRKRAVGSEDGGGDSAEVGGEPDDSDGQPP